MTARVGAEANEPMKLYIEMPENSPAAPLTTVGAVVLIMRILLLFVFKLKHIKLIDY